MERCVVELLRTYSNLRLTIDVTELGVALTRHRRSEAELAMADPAGPVPLTAALRAQIVELYRTGKLAREIGDQLGMSKTRVLKVLHDAEVVMRPGGPGRRAAES